MKKLKILIVNLDNLEFTRNCLKDLENQTSDDFEIVLVDQASVEEGTSEYLDSIINDNIEIVRNLENTPLNYVWSWFNQTYNNEILCFLNNDINLTSNFVESTISVFEKEGYVGIVVHSTNHLEYNKESEILSYKIVDKFKFMQGWDFSIRKALFPKLPQYVKTYCGDDFIFNYVYEKGFDLAYVLNSPIIHYEGQSKKSMKTSGVEDIRIFIENNNGHYLKINTDFSNFRPTFYEIIKKMENTNNKSNVGKWDNWYKEFYNNQTPSAYKYGDTETYQVGANFLLDCETIEDWGVGGGGFLRYCPKAIGVDGSDTPFAQKKHVDLCTYISSVEGVHMRHVLEHNYEWQKVLENALKSATKKLSITLFIPLNEGGTEELSHNLQHGVDVPDLSISMKEFNEIIAKYHPTNIETETFTTMTGYNTEIIYKITI